MVLRRRLLWLGCVVAALAFAGCAHLCPSAPVNAIPAGDLLSNLMRPSASRIRHFSSHDPQGKNTDYLMIAPGATVTLMTMDAPGIVRRVWCTPGFPSADKLRELVLRMYWDGETQPSVEVPLGMFFGVAYSMEQTPDFVSLPLADTGRGLNCYWPMPFRKSARITLTNESATPMQNFYYNLDVEQVPQLPADTLYFHAQWRRENPTRTPANYRLLEAQGRGKVVGVLMAMQALTGTGLTMLEGDEMFYVDGETTPSISGTGTEDYFNSAYYYATGPFSAPFHGCILKDELTGRVVTYRWHLADPIPFQQSIRMEMEHCTTGDRRGDYSSVVYWYQNEPHAAFPPLPPSGERMFRKTLPVTYTPEAAWWNRMLSLRQYDQPGATAECTFEGTGIIWYGFKGNHGGRAAITIDGRLMGTADQFAPGAEYFEWRHTGLTAGKHTIQVTILPEHHALSGGTEINVEAFEAIP